MSEKPDSDATAGDGDARNPAVPPVNADGGGAPQAPRAPFGTVIPPRPAAPPTSSFARVPAAASPSGEPDPQTATNRTRRTSPTGQVGQLLSDRMGQLRASGAVAKARGLAARATAAVRRPGRTKLIAGVAAVVVLALLIWWIAALAGGSRDSGAPAPAGSSASPTAERGALPLENVSPLDYRLGDCFKDFDANAAKSTVVACDTAHSAQLIQVESYAASDAYPGRDVLKQKALDACKAAQLTEKSGNYALSYKLAYPSSSSWGTGDRRVDCYAASDAGNVIMESLLP
ncbi:septum formation family protein [Arthrobacter sp. NPDC080082]|uniref:septum formation family protein n=1 Tax=unclassified Arthrobacter TaxID=235627 RepID=UPI00342E3EEB